MCDIPNAWAPGYIQSCWNILGVEFCYGHVKFRPWDLDPVSPFCLGLGSWGGVGAGAKVKFRVQFCWWQRLGILGFSFCHNPGWWQRLGILGFSFCHNRCHNPGWWQWLGILRFSSCHSPGLGGVGSWAMACGRGGVVGVPLSPRAPAPAQTGPGSGGVVGGRGMARVGGWVGLARGRAGLRD